MTEKKPERQYKYGSAFGDRMMGYPKGRGIKHRGPTPEEIAEGEELFKRMFTVIKK